MYVNASEQFAVNPLFTVAGVNTARREWDNYIEELRTARQRTGYAGRYKPSAASMGYPRESSSPVGACFDARSRSAFAKGIDDIVRRLRDAVQDSERGDRRSGTCRRLVEALVLMWRHELLLFPALEIWQERLIPATAIPPITSPIFGHAVPFISQMHGCVRWAGERRPIKVLPLTVGQLNEPGDIDEQVIAALRPFAPEPPNHKVYALCDQLLACQQLHYSKNPTQLQALPQSYRVMFKKARLTRTDPEFKWAAHGGDCRVAQWRTDVAAHLKSITNRVSLRYEIANLNALLDYAVHNTDIPATPLEYCRRDFSPRQMYSAFLREHTEMNETGMSINLRIVSRFFDAVLLAQASDDQGIVLREYCHPIKPDQIPAQKGRPGQTARCAIPTRMVRLMTQIIRSPNEDGTPTYSWPKSLKADYFKWTNSQTGDSCQMWSPVRAFFFVLRFVLPIRTLQARLLDSGDADPEIYSNGQWVKNEGPLARAGGIHTESTGLIRRIWDHDSGRWIKGIYITTNKTADRKELFCNTGYEIPWENKEIIELFCELRDWQAKYNPCLRPLSRAELRSDENLLVSQDVAERIDKLCFLFRDAASASFPQEPPTDGRLYTFWVALVAELENRLAAQNETNLDGSRICLVDRWTKDRPKSVIFDMHTLRVTGLTSLINAGVPIHIVSEFVAGHSSVLMTLYYHRPGAARITEVLDEAWERLSRDEARDWDKFLKSKPVELLHDLAAYNSEEGLSAARAFQSALWVTMDDGICPNGGTLCDVGGPRISAAKTVHAPVPGGPRNCVLCRFFVTGPPFLGGLVGAFNATAGSIREKCFRLKEAEERRRRVVAKVASGEERGTTATNRVALEDDVVDGAERELELLSRTWTARLSLIRRVEQIMHDRNKCGGKQGLVLNGNAADFEVAIKECSEFDLWDRICQSSVFYPSVDARLPSIRRARLFDAMLHREKLSTVFVSLSDQQLLEIGNAWAAFLRMRLGEENTNNLIAGHDTTRGLGIEEEIARLVDVSCNTPLRVTPSTAPEEAQRGDTQPATRALKRSVAQ